jgi:hypothetical protein
MTDRRSTVSPTGNSRQPSSSAARSPRALPTFSSVPTTREIALPSVVSKSNRNAAFANAPTISVIPNNFARWIPGEGIRPQLLVSWYFSLFKKLKLRSSDLAECQPAPRSHWEPCRFYIEHQQIRSEARNRSEINIPANRTKPDQRDRNRLLRRLPAFPSRLFWRVCRRQRWAD